MHTCNAYVDAIGPMPSYIAQYQLSETQSEAEKTALMHSTVQRSVCVRVLILQV